jgi:hypothetical protein
MLVEGRVWREKTLWLIELPLLDVMTQGKSKKDALNMIIDAISVLVNKKGFEISVLETGGDSFYLSTQNDNELISLILKRQRSKEGLSLEEVKKRINASSRNAYARYEKGSTKISMSKFLELFHAITNRDIILK